MFPVPNFAKCAINLILCNFLNALKTKTVSVPSTPVVTVGLPVVVPE
jgi:hypothetical protein